MNKPTTKSESRPRLYDDSILRAVAKELSFEVERWLGEKNTQSSIEQDLFEAMKDCTISDFDGYDLARQLEREYGYVPDSNLVEILSSAYVHAMREHRKQISEWIERNNIQATRKIDEKIKCCNQGKIVEGVIFAVYPKTLQYGVYVESLGHVKSGNGTRGLMVNAEEICS